MTDTVGLLTLPASAQDRPVGAPIRQLLGEFLAAHLNRQLQRAWSELQGNSKVVERVETNDPSDNTFSTTKLPMLAVYEANQKRQLDHLADEILLRRSQLAVIWIPPPVPQAHRAKREAFTMAVDAAIMNALRRGRTPGWIYPGDTDPSAPTRGSYLAGVLRLFQPIHYGMTTEDTTLQIEIKGGVDGSSIAKFPATRAIVQVVEQLTEGLDDVSPNTGEATYRTNGDQTTDVTQTYPLPE